MMTMRPGGISEINTVKTDEEYVAYKRERLEEIASIIQKSKEQKNSSVDIQE